MSIIREYTSNYVKANKKNRTALFFSITAAVILINAYVGFVYSIFMYSFKEIKKLFPWDAQTYQIPMSKVSIVEQNQNVKSISLQENFHTGKLKDGKLNDYIFLEGGDKRYWENFPNEDIITEGRVPKQPNEIIVNKLFLNKYPQLKIGDTITISFGKRIYNEKELLEYDSPISGEEFIEKKEMNLKICGSFLSMRRMNEKSSISIGLYYFDSKSLKENEEVIVNIFLYSKLNAYKKLFEITDKLGFERNKDGSYKIFTNTALLDMYGIKNPFSNRLPEMQVSILKGLSGLIILTFIFIYLIYNIFEVWAAKRIKQIAMLKSIGAGKGQIFQSILLEISLLSIPPILTGLILGVGFNIFLFNRINQISNSRLAENTSIFLMPQYEFGIIPTIVVIIFSFTTVLLASLIPALRLSKMNIIDSLKGNTEKSKKYKKKIFADHLWKKENQKNNFRTFRGTSNTIFIAYILLFGLLSLVTVYFISEDYKYYKSKNEMSVTYCLVDEDSEFDCSAKKVFAPFKEVKEISSSYYLLSLSSWFICSDNEISDKFKTESWFEKKHRGRYFWNADKNSKKLRAEIYGLDNKTFKKLLSSLGEKEEAYYAEDSYKAILINRVQKDWRIPYRNSQFIPLLNSNVEKLDCSLQKESNKTQLSILIGKQIEDTDLIETKTPLYSVLLVLPIEKAEKIRNAQIAFDKEGSEFFRDGFVYTLFLKMKPDNIVSMRKTVNNIMKPQLRGENVFWSSDIFIEKLSAENGVVFLSTVFILFLILVLLVGCINSYSTIKMNLKSRTNEFAILKSIGADSKIIAEIFYKETLFFLIKPLVCAIPFFFAIAAGLIIRFDVVFIANFLLNFNWNFFLFYFLLLSASVILCYYFSKKEIEKMDIIKSID